jgi:cytochrome P450 family 130
MAEADARFILRGGELWRSPWDDYAALRDRDPVHHVEDADVYVFTRFADVWNAARDHTTYSSAEGLTMVYGEMEKLDMGENVPMVFLDPPEHTRFRRTVSQGFTPRRVADIEPAIRDFVRGRIVELEREGSGDIVESVFKPLPSFVVAHYLGVPAEDRSRFDGWTDAIVAATAGEAVDSAETAYGELIDYFVELIERRRVEPGDDMISMLVGMGEETVGIMRILGFAFTMVTGGNDTVTGLLSASAQLLTEHRAQRQLLVDDPSLIENAVEELLRLSSPVQNLARTVTTDVDLHGTTIPKGRKVLLCYGAANRDEREFGPTAGDLDVTRRIDKFVTFSYGAHHCIGAAVARLQARVALEELLSICPGFEVDAAAGEFANGGYVRRYKSLPFTA